MRTGFLILRTSVSLIFKNKKLIVFPIFPLIGFVVIGALYLSFPSDPNSVLIADSRSAQGALFQERGADGDLVLTSKGFALFSVLYLFAMFIITFCNVAFFHEILEVLNGGEVKILRGFSFSIKRIKEILAWSLLAGAIGIIIAKLEQKFEGIARIIIETIGFTWSVSSVFAIPFIVIGEGSINPITTLKKSTLLLKKSWGPALIGFIGLQGGTILVILISLVLLMGLMIAGFVSDGWFLIGVLLVLGEIFLVGYLLTVVENVFKCVLFQYASKGVIPGGYSRELIEGAWLRQKEN